MAKAAVTALRAPDAADVPMLESSSNAYRSMPNRRRRRVTEIAHRTVEANGIRDPSRRGREADPSCSSATAFRNPGIRGAIS